MGRLALAGMAVLGAGGTALALVLSGQGAGGITLTKVSETQNTITLSYTHVTGAVGYRFSSSAMSKFSSTFDTTRTTVKFSKANSYKVEALGVLDDGVYPADTTTTSTTTTTTTAPPPPPPPPPPPGEPAPIAGQGYHQAFGDEFTSFNTAVWTNHAFYEDPVAGSVYVTNGVLNIDNTKAGGFTPEISVQSGPPYGGQPSRYDFTFGYAEARMRFSGGQGSWPAFWLESLGQALWDNYPNCPKKGPSGESLANANYELDIMEWLGADPQTRYASQHQNTGGTCGGPNGTRGADANVGVNLANNWHTYSVLWTASTTKFYVDGVQYGATANTYAEANQRMYVALTMQACGWDPPNGCNASTPDVLKTEVDWVHVWQQ